jgi:hypothetical protein
LDPSTPYGALAATTFTTLFVGLAAACSVPMRAPAALAITDPATY